MIYSKPKIKIVMFECENVVVTLSGGDQKAADVFAAAGEQSGTYSAYTSVDVGNVIEGVVGFKE